MFCFIFLGIVQGLTEFFPVSSSGHLAIFQKLFGLKIPNQILFDVFLHIGTLLSVFFVFKSEILELLKEFFCFLKDAITLKFNISKNYQRRLIIMLAVASSPLFIVAVFNKFFEKFFDNLYIIGIALIVTGILIWQIDKIKNADKTEKNASMFSAFLIGSSQVIAVVPGLSRSGITISSASFLGYEKKFAVKFSFFMSMIAIIGAAILKLPTGIELMANMGISEIFLYLLAIIASTISGFIAIKLFTKLLNNGKFHYFSYYCLIIGITTIYLNFLIDYHSLDR